jgi:hypothetical protein
VPLVVLWVKWKKGSHLDNGKGLPGAVADDDVADVRSLRRQTGLETVEDAERGIAGAERRQGKVRVGGCEDATGSRSGRVSWIGRGPSGEEAEWELCGSLALGLDDGNAAAAK